MYSRHRRCRCNGITTRGFSINSLETPNWKQVNGLDEGSLR